MLGNLVMQVPMWYSVSRRVFGIVRGPRVKNTGRGDINRTKS